MKVLVADANIDRDCWGAGEITRFSSVCPGATFYVRRAPDRDLPTSIDKYDRIILSGSLTRVSTKNAWTEEYDQFIRQALDKGVPILGICYGHQALIRVLGGQNLLRRSHTPEVGWTQIEQTQPSSLFEGLPERFVSFSHHFDEATELPQNCRLLARSNDCAIQAFEVEAKPVYGIQFHPERLLEEGNRTIQSLSRQHKALSPGKKWGKNFRPQFGQILFRNFLKESLTHAQSTTAQ